MRRDAWGAAALAGLCLLLALARPAQALITRLMSLAEVLDETTFVVTAKVDKLDPKRPAMVLNVEENLKGKSGLDSLPVLLTGDRRAVKLKEPPQLLKRLADKLPVVVFISKADDRWSAIGYTNGTWFSMTG